MSSKVLHGNPANFPCWQTTQVQEVVIYPPLYHDKQVCPLKQLFFLLSAFKNLGITSVWFWYDCVCSKAKNQQTWLTSELYVPKTTGNFV